MFMQCDEKKQVCLNYASNVPEWQLGLTLGAIADIGEADKPAARGFDQQTQNYTNEAKAEQSAPQPSYTQGSTDDFSVISDTDDLPF